MINNSIVFSCFLLVFFFYYYYLTRAKKRIKQHRENESYHALILQVLCKELILQQSCYYQVNDNTALSDCSQGFVEALMYKFRCLGLPS